MTSADFNCVTADPFDNRAGSALPTYPLSVMNIDQSSYHNEGTGISKIANLDLAFLSNTRDFYDPDVMIKFNPVSLTWSDFLNLFFPTPGEGFFINPDNTSSKAILFNNQTYESTNTNSMHFNINEQLIKGWTKKYGKPANIISPQMNILLSRFSFLFKSPASVKTYLVALSLDEAISTLIATNQIIPGDLEDSVLVKFNVTTHICCPFLKVALAVTAPYITPVPGYRSVNNLNRDYKNYYSGDTTEPRSSFINTLGINTNNVYNNTDSKSEPASDFLNKQTKSDANTCSSDSLIFDEVTKILSCVDDDGVSDGNSQW